MQISPLRDDKTVAPVEHNEFVVVQFTLWIHHHCGVPHSYASFIGG